MSYTCITTLIVFIFLSSTFTTTSGQETFHTRLEKTSVVEDAEKTYDFAKIISPLSAQIINSDNLFVYQGTYSITYQFDIDHVTTTFRSTILELPSLHICNRYKMLEDFCALLIGEADKMLIKLAEAVSNIKMLRSSTSKVSGLQIPQLVGVMSKDMTSSESSRRLEILQDDEEEFIKGIEKNVENMIIELMGRGKVIEKTEMMSMYSEILRQIWSQHQKHVLVFNETLTTCQNHHTPISLISTKMLENDVEEIRRKLNGSSFEVAVSAAEMFNLTLSDCSVRYGNLLQITINVPLRLSGNWTLQTIKPIPFISNGEKSEIFSDESNTGTPVAIVNSEYFIVKKLDYRKVMGGIYVEIQKVVDTLGKHSCLFGLLKNHSSSKLENVCHFPCAPEDHKVSIVPLGGTKYVVSGGKFMLVNCRDTERLVGFPYYGSLEITLDVCECQIYIFTKAGKLTLKSSLMSCDPKKKFINIIHVIPVQWTNQNFHNAVEQPFHSLDIVFNNDWRKLFQKNEGKPNDLLLVVFTLVVGVLAGYVIIKCFDEARPGPVKQLFSFNLSKIS